MNRHKTILLIDQAIFSGSSFLITFLLARWLDMETFGRYSGFVLINYLLASGIGAFTIQPFQVLLGQHPHKQQQYLSFVLGLHVCMVFFTVLSGICVHAILPEAFPLALPGFAAGFLLHDTGRRMLLALDKPVQTFLLDLLLAGLSFFILITIQFHEVHSVNQLLALLSLPYAASFMLLWIFLRPVNPGMARLRIFSRKHWRQGKWFFLTAVSQWWAGNLFVVAAGLYLGAAALGALRLAQSLMGVLNVLLQTFENYLLPQTSNRMRTNPIDGINYLTGSNRKAAWFFLPALAALFVMAEPLMVLAGGKDYAPFAYALQGMSLLYLLVFISQPVRLAIRALMFQQHFFFAYLLSLAFALLGAHELLSRYGLPGAIIGLGISQLILMVYWSIVLYKKNIPLWKSFISF